MHDDPAVLAAIFARMDVIDQEGFSALAGALDEVGLWRRPPVPLDLWLRPILIATGEEDPQVRIYAAKRLADLVEDADDMLVAELLVKLMSDDDPDVRYNAMTAAAELAGALDPQVGTRPIYEEAVHDLTMDSTQLLARQAWILLGLLDLSAGYRANWFSAPPVVADAILWMALRSNPHLSAPMVEALGHRDADPSVRAMAAYVLGRFPSDQGQRALLDIVVAGDLDRIGTGDHLILWRAILALDPQEAETRNALEQLQDWILNSALSDDRQLPLLTAVSHQLARSPTTVDVPTQRRRLFRLAALEGSEAAAMSDRVDPTDPEELRLAALAVSAEPSGEDFGPLLRSTRPHVRDLACVLAARRLSPPQHERMVHGLLWDYNDQAKISGAILAGLTGARPTTIGPDLIGFLKSHPELSLEKIEAMSDRQLADLHLQRVDLLERKIAKEEDPRLAQMLRLGRWMQGRGPPMGRNVAALLDDGQAPSSTVLLAMLHRHRHEVFDHLLNPRGEPVENLSDLLIRRRWWHVLKRYLPPDAPPLWLWADSQLQAFQIDVLRNWYLVNRSEVNSPESKFRIPKS